MTIQNAPIPAWIEGELVPVDKLEVHRRGLRHPAISVFLMNGDHTLLQKRATGKYHTPGLWTNSCCTHPFWREAPEECARRRLREELGIDDVPLKHRGQVEYRADVGAGLIEHEVVDVFVGILAGDAEVQPNPLEVEKAKWVGLEELRHDIDLRPSRYTPWLRVYLAEYAAQIFPELT